MPAAATSKLLSTKPICTSNIISTDIFNSTDIFKATHKFIPITTKHVWRVSKNVLLLICICIREMSSSHFSFLQKNIIYKIALRYKYATVITLDNRVKIKEIYFIWGDAYSRGPNRSIKYYQLSSLPKFRLFLWLHRVDMISKWSFSIWFDISTLLKYAV